ncbi:MAG TPA: ferritin-like fold-containing protein [Cryobacterium sp.]|nr:ferritin-like fold-containing protein [Cryobacterium sp.]
MWTDRRGKRVEAPRQSTRRERQSTTKVDIAGFTPELLPYLGQAAYFQLGMFENLALAISIAPDLAAKEELSAAAGRALAKHQGLVAEIRRRGGEPSEVMEPFAPRLDAFREQTAGADWHELLLSCYLAAGLLDDFFIRLSDGLPGDVGPRVAHLLGQDAGTDVLVTHLKTAIAAGPERGSHLALWGRRLVGDTLLVARSALPMEGITADESRIEPVFTELIAAHTRRMDGLGLTA